MQGVAGLQACLEGEGDLVFHWPGDLIAWIQKEGKLSDDFVLYGAWQTVGESAVADMIDTVRNRVLEFCLRLEEEMPELMGDDSNSSPTAAVESAASQVFNQVFVFGDHTGNIANASPAAEQSAQLVASRAPRFLWTAFCEKENELCPRENSTRLRPLRSPSGLPPRPQPRGRSSARGGGPRDEKSPWSSRSSRGNHSRASVVAMA